jgi:hypothetical protein
MSAASDIAIQKQGASTIVKALTERAYDWLSMNMPAEATMTSDADAWQVETDYVSLITSVASHDGLAVAK